VSRKQIGSIGVDMSKDKTKIFKFRDNRDELIDKLMDDKNRLYMEKMKLKKEIETLKNQLKYQKQKNKSLLKRHREIVDELLEESINKKSKA
tara:strand:- start:534 stop:809 length:276 start_codon:yes stop_codon:yes gene_type:complete